MAQHINRKETQVATPEGVGAQLEQHVVVDENTLPSPAELSAYKEIEPKIVDFLLTASTAEQEHRHRMEEGKLQLLQNAERRESRMNWWGMFFAFLSLAAFAALTAYALYLDKPWMAAIMGSIGLLGIITVFVNAGKAKNS